MSGCAARMKLGMILLADNDTVIISIFPPAVCESVQWV